MSEAGESAVEAAAEASGTDAAVGGKPASGGMDFVLDVPVRMTVEIGSARLLVRDVLQLGRGSVVELDRASGEPADVLVNGRLVARAEVTVVEDRVAIKVIEVVGGEGGAKAPTA